MKIIFKLNKFLQQRQHEKQTWIFPVKLAMYATYLYNQGHNIVWDSDEEGDRVITSDKDIDVHFLELPVINRNLVDSKNPKWQNNGNFKYLPATYMQVADGCWWGKCKFCVEQYSDVSIRSVDDVIEEIDHCIVSGHRELFDDSGTFPVGYWLDNFLKTIVKYGNTNITLGCNMRLVDVDYRMMKLAGFRMLLFGVESANQHTLDTIRKGTKTEDIKYLIKASKEGLDCHPTFMFGYPWETDEDSIRTLELAHYLLREGYATTAQASFFDCSLGANESQRKYVKQLYNIGFSPKFWLNKLKTIKNKDDLKYIWRGIKAYAKDTYNWGK